MYRKPIHISSNTVNVLNVGYTLRGKKRLLSKPVSGNNVLIFDIYLRTLTAVQHCFQTALLVVSRWDTHIGLYLYKYDNLSHRQPAIIILSEMVSPNESPTSAICQCFTDVSRLSQTVPCYLCFSQLKK
jgi:hypothetical protein